MRRVIRLVVAAVTVLGASAAWNVARADETQEAVQAPATRLEPAARPEPPRQVFEPGAASLEPAQSIDETPGTVAHRAWLESIWSSP
jgi:hypothetical protein